MRHGIRIDHVKRSTGQALILVMLTLPLLFSVSAVVVDGTTLMVNKRQMQNAADASALAAAQEVEPAIAALEACPPADSACRLAVQNNAGFYDPIADTAAAYVAQNWHGGTPPTLTRCASADEKNCWSWPYQKDIYGVDAGYSDDAYHYVQVKLQRPVSGFFASLAGAADLFNVGARAVAATLTEPITGTETVANPGATNTFTNPDQLETNYSTVYQTVTNTTTTGGGRALLYAHCGYPGDPCSSTSDACDALHISGTGNTFYGAIVSAGGVNESGSNFGKPPNGDSILYYGTTDVPKCLTWKPSWAIEPPVYRPPIDWPVPPPTLTCSNGSTGNSCPDGTWATQVNGVNCTKLPSDKFTVNSATNPTTGLPWSGLYCATEKITINKTGITINNSGWIAPEIGWSSGNDRLTGYNGLYSQYGGLLFDAYGSGGLNWSGSGDSWQGAIFAPNGNAQVSGGGAQGTCGGILADACGFIEGLTVQVSGGGGTWAGLGPSVGGSVETTTTTIATATNANTVTVVTGSTYTVSDPGNTVTNTVTVGTTQTYAIDE